MFLIEIKPDPCFIITFYYNIFVKCQSHIIKITSKTKTKNERQRYMDNCIGNYNYNAKPLLTKDEKQAERMRERERVVYTFKTVSFIFQV